MHQQLAAIERAEAGRERIAKPDDAEQLVVDRIGDRDGVGELLGGVDAIAMADRNVGVGGRAWDLSGRGVPRADENYGCQKSGQIEGASYHGSIARAVDRAESFCRTGGISVGEGADGGSG